MYKKKYNYNKKCLVCKQKIKYNFLEPNKYRDYHKECIWKDKDKYLYNHKIKKKINYLLRRYHYTNQISLFSFN